MSPGTNVQYVTGTIESPTYAAAVVTDVYGPDTVGLTVFPGANADTVAFTPEECDAGIAQRPTVNRGESPGQWRPIPEETDTAKGAETETASPDPDTPGEDEGGGEVPPGAA